MNYISAKETATKWDISQRRVARTIKEKVLDLNGVRTMIPTRLQHWPKYRKPSNNIKI